MDIGIFERYAFPMRGGSDACTAGGAEVGMEEKMWRSCGSHLEPECGVGNRFETFKE